MNRVILEKLPVPQLVNKFPAFYATRRFFHHIHNSPSPCLEPDNIVYTLPSHICKIHYKQTRNLYVQPTAQ